MNKMIEKKQFSSLEMAIAVLMERIQSLPKQDREELYELSKAVFSMDDDDERESAARAMQEILEQSPITVRAVDLPDQPGEELDKWIAYISSRIRELRKKAGMTQTQLAEKAGIPQSHVSRLENGEHSPSFTTLEKIAMALNVPVSKLDPSA